MTDLSTSNLKRLLAETSPGPWEARGYYMDGEPRPDDSHQIRSADGEYLGIMHGQNAHLTALAPELAQEVLRMREALRDLSEVWEAVSIGPFRTPAEQQLAAAVVAHIDQILGGQDG